MDLTTHVERLRAQLAATAEAGGEDAHAVADRLATALEPATRLVLLDALSEMADEVTRELAPGSVELRLRSGEPEVVVTLPPEEQPARHDTGIPLPPDEDDAAVTARINLRLPERLKEGVDEAAARERLSTNAWLVRLIATALAPPDRGDRGRGGRPGQSYTGWVG